ncbi:right-handed parallel beta-helix repeat-containing protein [Fibrisoma montanum]|uniref:Right-handed parallel beta-helix repeat-containing protein n=1 Tax=Fibrisoma montanum TaxID=2305895 RepID=A0A418M3E5_9BACT|nr:right-handed parallel beta-helix repeat-containing protein [Fibrisoma montanum]RIV20346.1 right-handed parallel beta-helix repeat-containing protein [Fibrisoma montanum]
MKHLLLSLLLLLPLLSQAQRIVTVNPGDTVVIVAAKPISTTTISAPDTNTISKPDTVAISKPTPTPAPKPAQRQWVPKFTISKPGMYDGASIGVKPGDTIGVAGTLSNLILRNVKGAPGKPVVILNYGGVATIRGKTQNNGNLSMQGCAFIKFSGSGVDSIRYGFRIGSEWKDVSALVLSNKTTNVEIERVEIDTSGFAGIMAKTDPAKGDPSTWLGNFVMQDLSIHDCYVHDTRGEGLYIGNSFWNGGMNGLYPHEIHGLQVYNNLIERAGCEGIQYSCSPDASVHHNTVRVTGISPFSNAQNAGVQISGGSSGTFEHNTIEGAAGIGLIVVGACRAGDTLHIRNVLVKNSNVFAGTDKLPAETAGVFCDERGTPPGIGVGGLLVFENVTVDGARLDGFRLYNEKMQNVIRQSVIRNFTRFAVDRSPKTVPVSESGNVVGNGAVPVGVGYQENKQQ